MQTLWQDLRYGTRMLLKSPGFTVVIVISLAMGIGANTAIFSFIDALLLRPLPVKQPDQLVRVMASQLGVSSHQDYLDYRDRNEVFSGLAAISDARMIYGSG